MTPTFQILLSLGVSHTYYGGDCDDFSYLIPADTALKVAKRKWLARDNQGRWIVLYAPLPGGPAPASVAGLSLVAGLQLAEPNFSNFTDFSAFPNFARPSPGGFRQVFYYANRAAATALDPARQLPLVPPVFSHRLTSAARPAGLVLKNAAGSVLQTDLLDAGDARTSLAYDLRAAAPGLYTVEENYPAPAATVVNPYYCHAELLAAGVFGIVEINLSDAFFTTPPAFTVTFQAKQETLKYYVVATNYAAADFASLAVADAAPAGGGRPIAFASVAPAAFAPADVPPALLGAGAAQVVLFKSTAPVARSAAARAQIQLRKGAEVLIPSLPQPGPQKSNSDLIVTVSKSTTS